MRAVFTLCISLGLLVNSYARISPLLADGSNYDIIYHRISFTLNPAVSKAISNGSVTTYFRTTKDNVTSLQFDLDGAMSVSSATYHGSAIAKSHNAATDILTLTLPNIAAKGTLDSVTVFYSGSPTNPSTSIPSGYNYQTHGTNSKAIYTLDEAFTGHYWWPCKESLYDKIDSCTELIITAPNGYKVSANGVVSEEVGPTNTVTAWKTFYPIATYGINFACANYVVNSSTMVTGGQTLNMYNYLYPEDNKAAYQNAMGDMKTMINMYVSVFGVNYPFLNEQYGMTECTGTWGALEVQSMTFMARGGGSGYSKSTIAHELSHQWFGDMLTTNSWHHVWLNEGFAQYCESVVYPENLLSASSAANSRSNLKSSVNSTSTAYVADTSNADKIFFGSSASQPYEKGAMVLSMLRAWLGDQKFFLALKNYLNAPGLKYNFTSVDSLQKYMQAQSKVDLTDFFNDWVYKKGKVSYSINYQYVTNGVYIQLASQSSTSSGAGYFDTPVPLRIRNNSGFDTTIVVIDKRNIAYNNVTGRTYASNTIYYPLSQTPTIAPTFDPNNVVLATASIGSSSSLNSLIVLPFKELKVSAVSEGSNVRVDWYVNTDEALQSIIVEKSLNGVDFEAAQNNSVLPNGTEIYRGVYADQQVAGRQYYRLKIVKNNGAVIYSAVESVSINLSLEVRIAPNPVQSELNVVIPHGFGEKETLLLIYNSSGQVVSQTKLETAKEQVSIFTQQLTPGMYNLILINRSKEKLQAKFLKN